MPLKIDAETAGIVRVFIRLPHSVGLLRAHSPLSSTTTAHNKQTNFCLHLRLAAVFKTNFASINCSSSAKSHHQMYHSTTAHFRLYFDSLTVDKGLLRTVSALLHAKTELQFGLSLEGPGENSLQPEIEARKTATLALSFLTQFSRLILGFLWVREQSMNSIFFRQTD